MLCELTYVCALASAHTLKLFVYMHILTNTLILHHKYYCSIINTLVYKYKLNRFCVNAQVVVPLQVLTLRTSLYTYICSQVYIFHITATLVYDSVLCELTYVCALASAHT